MVPVYSRGQRTDGSPYYAMRFVSGLSFQQAIDEFHAADKSGRDLQERSLALRQLLRRFVDVCNTIAFAHAKGILHRDIKPANILLGGYGETLVVDWGLAKEMKSGDAPPQSGGLGIPVKTDDVNDFDATKVGYTLYGQAMGTPAFMSPEQAAGQWDVTGVASDVYSLGAMLYTILSGSPPFSGPTMEVLTKVQRGDFKPIHAVKGNIPGPLGAVCRKSMSLKIEDRYRKLPSNYRVMLNAGSRTNPSVVMRSHCSFA
ncbi:MAG: serine/threonine-protein kinase [Gemmataceae bacterium]